MQIQGNIDRAEINLNDLKNKISQFEKFIGRVTTTKNSNLYENVIQNQILALKNNIIQQEIFIEKGKQMLSILKDYKDIKPTVAAQTVRTVGTFPGSWSQI